MTTLTLEVEANQLGDIHPLELCAGHYRDVVFALKGGGMFRLELVGNPEAITLGSRARDDSTIDYGATTIADATAAAEYRGRVAP